MISEIKKYWIYILAFLVLNYVFFSISTILSEPYEIGDLIAPMILIFQIIGLLSAFFAALVVTFVLFSKTENFQEQLTVITISIVLFASIGIVLNFSTLLTFEEKDWEQGYLDAVLALPFEFDIDQFKTLTYFNAVNETVSSLLLNVGSAFFGFLVGRKLRSRSSWKNG